MPLWVVKGIEKRAEANGIKLLAAKLREGAHPRGAFSEVLRIGENGVGGLNGDGATIAGALPRRMRPPPSL
jgi:hypothetical protein